MIIPTGFTTSQVIPVDNPPEPCATLISRSVHSPVPTTPQTPVPTTAHIPMPTTPSINTESIKRTELASSVPDSTESIANITPSTNRNVNDAGFLTPLYLSNLMKNCCSRKNFATKLVCKLFDEETRKKSNVAGKLGKASLNPVVMEYVKSLTFQYYPLETGQKEEKEWKSCVIAIDSNSRSLNRKK